MPSAPRVHLIDDDASVRTAVVRLLRAEGLEATAHADVEAFLAAQTAPLAAPACLLLDVGLPGRDGLDAQAALAARHPAAPIVFLSGRDDAAAGVRALKAGALDYLVKPIEGARLVAAVRDALGRSERLAAEAASAEGDRRKLSRLTPRECQVLVLVSRGLLNKEVADRLGTAEKTVKVQRASVMTKLDAVSVAELVRFVDRLGLDRSEPIPAPAPAAG